MPCSDGGSWETTHTEYVDNPETKKRLDKVTRLLCFVMRNLTPADRKQLYSYASNGKALAAWWYKHQEEDRKRELEESRRKALQTKKKKALAKLTTEDRKLLNLE